MPNTSTCKYACAHTRIAVQSDKPALVLGIRNTHGDEKASPQTHTTQIKHIAHTVTTHSRHGAEKICLFPLPFLFLANRCRLEDFRKVQKRAELNKFESTLEKALCHAPGCRRGSRALEMLTLQRQARACTSPFVHSCKKHTVKGALTPTGDTSQHLIRLPRAALQFQRTARPH